MDYLFKKNFTFLDVLASTFASLFFSFFTAAYILGFIKMFFALKLLCLFLIFLICSLLFYNYYTSQVYLTQIHFICLGTLFCFAFLILFFLDLLEVKDGLLAALEVDLEIQNSVLESKDDELKSLQLAETERLEKTLTDKETATRQNLLLFGVVLYIITCTTVRFMYYPG
jgi:hypothetical protein